MNNEGRDPDFYELPPDPQRDPKDKEIADLKEEIKSLENIDVTKMEVYQRLLAANEKLVEALEVIHKLCDSTNESHREIFYTAFKAIESAKALKQP